VLLLAVAAYAPTLGSSFHFDDHAIFADAHLTSPEGWWRVFRPQQTRPLTYFTFWVNYRLGEADPRGYHAVNLASHLGAVLAAWSALRRILAARGALIAAAIFALHPLQSEAVAYVFARATLLATLFCLLAWRDWLKGRWWRAAGWFALGLLAKEECVAFPLFLLALEWVQGRRRVPLPLAAMLSASVAAGARLLYVAGRTAGAGLGAAAGIDAWTYIQSQPKVICHYLFLFLCPVGQNFDHDVRPDWLSGVAAAALIALIFVAWRRLNQGGIWVLGALVLLAPSSSVIPVADVMFEHRMYLPLVSLSVAAAMALEGRRWLLPAALALLLTAATWSRASVWLSDVTLWSDAAAKSPNKSRPKLQLARALAPADPARAQALILEARRLEPSNPETFTQMGALLLERNPARALAEFDQALRLLPRSPDAHSNRGTALYLLGRTPEAEAAFVRALELDPAHKNARHNLDLLRGAGRR
jgi:tetratricopeptide (TPR) repeat protein